MMNDSIYIKEKVWRYSKEEESLIVLEFNSLEV